MQKEHVKKYILEQFYKYNNIIFGWRNHRNRARFIYNLILKEDSLGSLDLIIKNEISLMESGISLGDNEKKLDCYFNSKWSKSMKNRNHVTVQNSEYRRVLDRCDSVILKYLDLRRSSFSQYEIRQNSFSQHEIRILKYLELRRGSFSQHEINEEFLKNKIREVKNDFKAKISNTCPEYSVLLATKIFFNKEYNNVLKSLKQNQRVIDKQLDIFGARHMAGIYEIMSNPEDHGVFYTIETFGLPKLDGAYNEVLVQKNKEIINAKNIENLKEILPKNNLYLVRSGGSGDGHFFCMYVSFDNFFKIDVMGGDDLCCQPLIKFSEFNDDFAEKFRFTGSIYFYRINDIEDIIFFVKVIVDEEYRNTLIF